MIPLTLILLLTTFQTASATQERYDPQNPGDMRERRPAEDMRERRPAEDMRERRPAEDMRERRPAEDMRVRRPADDLRERRPVEDMRERRPAEDMRERRPVEDMRERRPVEDMRERRPAGDMGERRPATDMRERRDSSSQRSTDRPWRETLAKCGEMKKAGKLSRAMKEECKAARELRKVSSNGMGDVRKRGISGGAARVALMYLSDNRQNYNYS